MSQDFRDLLSTEVQSAPNTVPVWRRMVLQLIAFALLALAVVLVSELLRPEPTQDLGLLLALGIVVVPPALWLGAAVAPEYRVMRPRRRLLGVAIISALVASAIGSPVLHDFFRIVDWLPHESAFGRIIGYTLTAGMLDAGLKLLILRAIVVPRDLRVRGDAIAYAMASAVGYSFFLNLELILSVQPSPDIAAIYVLANYVIQFASAMFIAIGLSESFFSDALPPVLPMNILLAGLSTGIISSVYSGVMGGALTTQGSSDRPLFGIGFLIIALIGFCGITYFLYRVSERRERETYYGGWDNGV